MRRFLIALAACGGSASRATTSAPAPAAAAAPRARLMHATSTERGPIDTLGALSQPRVETGWIVPGPAQLVLGGTSLQVVDDLPLEVDVIEERGGEVRVGVRLEHVRFAVWTARSRMLAVVAREQPISGLPAGSELPSGGASATLRAGARVQRLARKNGFTQIRYAGSLEVEGWIPDDSLSDRGPAGHSAGRRIIGRRPLMVHPGATIRTEKRWQARALAVAYYSTFVDAIDVLDDGWHRVSYSDGDISVQGFLNKREPPSRTQPRREPEQAATVTPNLTVPGDTCLYAADEVVGFVVGDRQALVERSPRIGWFTVTLDTPWGPVGFEASGPTETTLAKCAGTTP